MDWPGHLQHLLNETRTAGLWRELTPTPPCGGPWITHQGQRLLDFSSNDYLGLRQHPALAAALEQALAGGLPVGAGASRYVGGSHPLHFEVEQALATFKGFASARLFSSGYLANLGVLQALLGPEDVLFSDALNHASLIDGARLCRARVVVFQHNDLNHLENLLQNTPVTGQRMVAVESVYSMDGDLAPLAELTQLCARHDALLLVDEAHATGLFGPSGRGRVAEVLGGDACPCPLVVVATLGKGLGMAGGAVLAAETIIQVITQKARTLIFDTAPALCLMPPLLASLALLVTPPVSESGKAVLSLAQWLRGELQSLGYDTGASQSQIIPLITGSNHSAMALAAHLQQQGNFARGIRYPTVPQGKARVRLTLTALHTQEMIEENLLGALKTAG